MRSWLYGLATVTVLAAGSNALAGGAEDLKGERGLARAVEGRTVGEPVDCIDPKNAHRAEIIDKTAILYYMPGGKLYVNRPEMGAASLDRDAIIYSRTVGAQLCRRDVVRMVDRGGHGPVRGIGNVGLGRFVPYEKAQR